MKKYVLRNKFILFMSVIFGVLEVVFTYLYVRQSSRIIDVVMNKSNDTYSKVIILSILYVILLIIAHYIFNRLALAFSKNIINNLRHEYIEGLLDSKTSLFFKVNKGEHLSHIDQDVDQLRMEYLYILPYALIGIGRAIVYTIGLYKIHPYMLITTFLFVILPALASKIFTGRISKSQIERSGKYSKYIDELNELLDGYLVIKESRNNDYFLEKFDKANNELLKAINSFSINSPMLSQTLFGLNVFSTLLVTFIGGILVKNSLIQMSDLLASLSLVSIATASFADTFRFIVQLLSTRELRNIVISKIPNEKIDKKIEKLPKLDLNINNLSFSYGDKKVFSDMNIDIEKNMAYAIIGPSGSGKSTLAKILMRINPSYEGKITFENGDFKDFKELELYETIYYIPQEPVIFEDTFINNITMGRSDIDMVKLDEIIDRVGLDSVYNDKKESLIKNDSLSGGEKKKLEIARALYRGADVLIFDEPTSGLDPESARVIDGLIESLDYYTRIVITHNQDASYLDRFDKVINVENYK